MQVIYVSYIRCHSLPNLSDLWPANASKIDNKEVMESNLYPFIQLYFFPSYLKMNCTKKSDEYSRGGDNNFLFTALQVNLQLKVLVKTVHPFLHKQCIFSYKCETLFCLFIYHFFLLNEITYYKIVKRIKTKQN